MTTPSLDILIGLTKGWRKFDAQNYLLTKAKRINHFFKENNLDSAVIGISGGVDSAVVLGLFLLAQEQKDSPLKTIMPLSIPIFDIGVSGQINAQNKAELQCLVWDIPYVSVNATGAYRAIVEHSLKCDDAWAQGQMASIVRTPILYYHAAILQQKGYKSIVVGTTNRDEGSYIGFFGKASDAMVDLQPIADIHKSEVYKVAKLLGVIPDIMDDAPKGDVWDGRNDEQMIGAPYWFLELYLLTKEHDLEVEWDGKEKEYVEAIEAIHAKNAHKYQVGNPAHFIDVMQRTIVGGWEVEWRMGR